MERIRQEVSVIKFIGIDIGGIKCAVVSGNDAGEVIQKEKVPKKD